jgi:hypothetical protein
MMRETDNKQRNQFLILLPERVKISQVVADLGKSLAQRYFLILSSIYTRGLLSKKIQSKPKCFLFCYNKILRELGGEKYRSLMDYGIKNGHLIQRDEIAGKGYQSLQYRLNQKVVSLKTQQRFQLTTEPAKNARARHLARSRERFVRNGEDRQVDPALLATWGKILNSYDGVTFDYSAAIKFVADMPEGNDKEKDQKDYRRNYLENLMLDGEVWTTDDQGRNYTIMVSTPRNIRRFFSYGTEPLWVVDISSSQPVIHIVLYPEECEEKQRYRSFVEGGTFWDFMNKAAGEPYDLTDPDDKTALKKRIFREVFYSWNEADWKRPKTFATIFAGEFPVLWNLINSHKQKDAAQNHNYGPSAPLAKEMQRDEADIVANTVERLKDKSYPLITIHDAIVTTADGVNDVKTGLESSFRQIGLFPRLVPKQLTDIQ